MSKNEAQTGGGTPKGDAFLFFRNFFRHPRMLGSIIPSSRFLIKQLLQPIDWDKARVIVEYGPGVGGITAEILRRMRPDARLIAIEMNPEFVSFLRKTLVDERFQVVEGSAADVRDIMQKSGHSKADYIISGVPLGSMPQAVREAILRNTCEALATGGSFLVFQFTTRVLPDLNRFFRYVRRKFEPLNILPAHLFFCQPGTA
ncbi:MAG TPA: methyltransferase domain-containing protein [Steroidobacteraceae bacterium]|nr:methyltransferase domain-containing protein [Steroidobacteraceae bacterium]